MSPRHSFIPALLLIVGPSSGVAVVASAPPAAAADLTGAYRLAAGDGCRTDGVPPYTVLGLQRRAEGGYQVLQTLRGTGAGAGLQFASSSERVEPLEGGRLAAWFRQQPVPESLQALGREWVMGVLLQPDAQPGRLWVLSWKLLLTTDGGRRPLGVVLDLVRPEGGSFGADELSKFRGRRGLCMVRQSADPAGAGAALANGDAP